ncbi:hypothetical protein O3Q51_10840 [Cryomorphaceae bacterium 1068]|nr:hypothetical protein [Cryomorphaceae bacterium 1068]
MKRFLIRIAIWGALLAVTFGIVIAYHAGPRTDYFYNRFTQPKARNLILGSSRAAQGINPAELDEEGSVEFFNYSFTNYNSPYGQCYFAAAKKKFLEKNGAVTILEVNPFTLSNYRKNMKGDEEIFEECETAPSNMWMIDADPNFEYIIRNYSDDLRTLTGIKPRPYAIYLHDDGWLEIEMPFDTAYFKENTEDKVRNYNELVPKMKPSTERWKALNETVAYFKKYGEVFLVRVPVSPEMEEIEKNYYPSFDSDVMAFANGNSIEFLNYFDLNDSLYFTDGNHLHRESARRFSKILGEDIKTSLHQ